jgi:hypothetical protein
MWVLAATSETDHLVLAVGSCVTDLLASETLNYFLVYGDFEETEGQLEFFVK